MARNKKLIQWLLILSIGFMPVFGLSAAGMQHMDHDSSSCIDCDPMKMAIDLPCENDGCLPAAHTCGVNFCAGFIPESTGSKDNRIFRLVNNLAEETAFRSHLDQSIYRPPIS